MRPIAFSLAFMTLAFSCSKEPASSRASKGVDQEMVIRVAGMQKGEGGKT